MELKFKVGDKVKLTEIGLNGVAHNYNVNKNGFQNVEAEITYVDIQSFLPYSIKFPNGSIFRCDGDEIIAAYIEEDSETEKILGYFETMASDIGKLVDQKQLAYGNSVDKTYRLMKIFLEKWDNGNDTYTIPESLLKHILLQVRLIDKQNRIFNNPDADLMQENPYSDSVGYNMLGVRMMENT